MLPSFDDADITELEAFSKVPKAEGEKRGIKCYACRLFDQSDWRCSCRLTQSLIAHWLRMAKTLFRSIIVNMGMAVDTPRGLVVPVIKNADEKGIWEISADIMALAAKAPRWQVEAR